MSSMHPDQRKYWDFRRTDRIIKDLNTLMGIVQGVVIDDAVNRTEADFLRAWISEHEEVRHLHPYSEIMAVVEPAIADGVITDDERQDIQYLCANLLGSSHVDHAIIDMQRLHAILAGIGSDGTIAERELRGLSEWLDAHHNLRKTWPYEEACSLVTGVLSDGAIDEREHQLLKDFCSEFVAIADQRTVVNPPLRVDGRVVGLCAVCPQIDFPERSFCLTGASSRFTRNELSARLVARGARVASTPSGKTDYLVICDGGNPCWTYTCYGRKIERAAELRKAGSRIMIIHEHDLLDALAEAD